MLNTCEHVTLALFPFFIILFIYLFILYFFFWLMARLAQTKTNSAIIKASKCTRNAISFTKTKKKLYIYMYVLPCTVDLMRKR